MKLFADNDMICFLWDMISHLTFNLNHDVELINQ